MNLTKQEAVTLGGFYGRTNTKVKVHHAESADIMQRVLPVGLKVDDVTFVCIGTDRSTGDSLGPLVGSFLKRLGYANVIGTLDEPIHAMNLDERLREVPKGKCTIAIDACLGQLSSVGMVQAGTGSIEPGAGVNKNLTPVGDYHITGIVNVGGFMEFFVLQNTRLNLVMSMADAIVRAIVAALPNRVALEIAASHVGANWGEAE